MIQIFRRFLSHKYSVGAMLVLAFLFWPGKITAKESSAEGLLSGHAYITKLKSPVDAGRGYRLVYLVKVPLDVYWRFKTDFNNEFLITNKYIIEHQFVRRIGNIFITENVYTHRPRIKFKWRTTIFPTRHSLEYILLNLKESGQNYHYGYILLEAMGDFTKVIHVAYFDFWGAFLWANYPWRGGMASFLRYMARWEQETVPPFIQTYNR